jgi:hypothetical protein
MEAGVAPPDVLKMGNWLKMRGLDAAPMNTSLPTKACVLLVAGVVEFVALGDGAD